MQGANKYRKKTEAYADSQAAEPSQEAKSVYLEPIFMPWMLMRRAL